MRSDHEDGAQMCIEAAQIRESLAAENPGDFDNKHQLVKTYAVLSSAEMELGDFSACANHLTLIPDLTPNYSFGRSVAAIGWLQMALRIETRQEQGTPSPSPLTPKQCRQRAIEQLNLVTELEDFDLPSITRMEIFSGLMHVPEYRAQLADVYQEIDLDTLPPPMWSESHE